MRAGDAKTARILDAARDLVLTHGPRGTSMEAIARAAGIAKPTLYAYFPDKPAVLAALRARLVAEWRTAAFAALDAEGDPVPRIAVALVARHRAATGRLAASPHAEALHDAPAIAAFEAEFRARIEAMLAAAGAARPRFLAQVLLAAGAGIAREAQSAAELGPPLRLLTERLLRPEVSP